MTAPRRTLTEGILPMKHALVILALVLLQLSCTDSGVAPQDRSFNVTVKFGIGARNELNTFNDTYTKDLCLDGTAVTRLVLLQSDFDSIESRLQNIDIFSYPDTFIVPRTDTVVRVNPFATYVLTVKIDSRWKEVFWQDNSLSSDIQAIKLRETFEFIRKLVEGKPEYKQLPPARGGYL
jgi:hypothetical protein